MKVNARVILARCSQTQKLFGIRMEEKPSGIWEMDWAFKLDEERAQTEGYNDEQLNVKCDFSYDYPGCPYCERTGWVQCGNCGNIVCYDSTKDENGFDCPWCGEHRENFIDADEFNLNSDQF